MSQKMVFRKETRELTIIARPRVREKRFCAACRAEVRWLVPEEAMLLAKTNLREIFRLVELREIHFVESREGFLHVCAESLANRGKYFVSYSGVLSRITKQTMIQICQWLEI